MIGCQFELKIAEGGNNSHGQNQISGSRGAGSKAGNTFLNYNEQANGFIAFLFQIIKRFVFNVKLVNSWSRLLFFKNRVNVILIEIIP